MSVCSFRTEEARGDTNAMLEDGVCVCVCVCVCVSDCRNSERVGEKKQK